MLTTGFDAPHVDLIAILRPTESVSLYQQIVGRGLRLCDGKQDCLILDYAGNPHDLYTPEVGSRKPHGDSQPVQVFCPACGFANTFWGKCDGQGRIVEHYGGAAVAILRTTKGDASSVTIASALKLPAVQCGKRYRRPPLPSVRRAAGRR